MDEGLTVPRIQAKLETVSLAVGEDEAKTARRARERFRGAACEATGHPSRSPVVSSGCDRLPPHRWSLTTGWAPSLVTTALTALMIPIAGADDSFAASRRLGGSRTVARAVMFLLALRHAAATVYNCDGTAQDLQGEYAGVEFDFDQSFVLQMDINVDASQSGSDGSIFEARNDDSEFGTERIALEYRSDALNFVACQDTTWASCLIPGTCTTDTVAGTTYTFKIEFDGTTISLSKDGAEVCQATVDTSLVGFGQEAATLCYSGSGGIGGWNGVISNFTFSNLEPTSVPSAVPTSSPPSALPSSASPSSPPNSGRACLPTEMCSGGYVCLRAFLISLAKCVTAILTPTVYLPSGTIAALTCPMLHRMRARFPTRPIRHKVSDCARRTAQKRSALALFATTAEISAMHIAKPYRNLDGE